MADVAETKTDSVEKNETPENVEAKNEAAEDKSEAAENEESNGTKAEEENATDENKSETEKKVTGKALEASIIRQVEYYFGDANLHRDKFLNEQISKNEEGWVPLSVLLTFKRLAALSTDADVIIDALSKSEEGLIEISEDRTQIRRHPERPLPEHNEERRKEIMTRTAYAKGFPLDWKMSDLIEFFEPFQKVANITMRKYYDKSEKEYKFKGSVFVTFENKEQTKDFIEKEGLTCKDKPLDRKWQEDYLAMKREERTKQKKKGEKGAEKKEKKHEERDIILPTGTVLYFDGITDDTKREVIHDAVINVDPESTIAYIEYKQGQKEGKIRFHTEGRAEKFLERLGGKKLKIKEGMEITLRTLSQDEEEEFLKQVVNNMKNLRYNKNRYDKGNNRKRRLGNFNKKSKKQRYGGGGSDDE